MTSLYLSRLCSPVVAQKVVGKHGPAPPFVYVTVSEEVLASRRQHAALVWISPAWNCLCSAHAEGKVAFTHAVTKVFNSMFFNEENNLITSSGTYVHTYFETYI